MSCPLSRRTFLASTAAWTLVPPGLKADMSRCVAGRCALYETAAGLATDAVWCRRVYLDLAGRIPTAGEAQGFAADKSASRRERLVDALLASPDYADYWSMRYADLLCVKSEFPINLWPNAVYVYHRRIRQSLERDESWLAFARALLSARGSNFRDAETNFFRATAQRDATGLSRAASRVFLGAETEAYAPYFEGVRIKETREWKEEIVYCRDTPKTPDDFGRLLSDELREAFARTHAGRIWTWIFTTPPDAVRAARLGAAFEEGGFRLKPFLRRLVLSGDYARGSLAGGFPVRRLEAEVLEDALCSLTGLTRSYQSNAPEPFTFLPPGRKSVLIEDGSITGAFLILFGRPARDTGLPEERRSDVSAKARLYLFNSARLHGAIDRWTTRLGKASKSFRQQVKQLYWSILARPPSAEEWSVISRRLAPKRNWRDEAQLRRDVAWCLINSSEFLFRV